MKQEEIQRSFWQQDRAKECTVRSRSSFWRSITAGSVLFTGMFSEKSSDPGNYSGNRRRNDFLLSKEKS